VEGESYEYNGSHGHRHRLIGVTFKNGNDTYFGKSQVVTNHILELRALIDLTCIIV
jgi:hypothetical protein